MLVFGKKGFPFLGHGAKVRMSFFERCLFSEKKVSRFWDLAQKCACPFLSDACFRKKRFPVFGTWRKSAHVLF
jgi:hypothetical protein